MIGFLSGKIHSTSEQTMVINVRGVGYEVFVTKNLLLTHLNEQEDIELEVYTHVNETTLQLFGFKTSQEKLVFQKLISVSGIGPKLGLGMLSDMPTSQLLNAIAQEDTATLTKIKGLGKKTAERIVIELKDKFKDMVVLDSPIAANDAPQTDSRLDDALSALVSLGYPEFHAKKVINKLELSESDTVQSLIKKSLGTMAQAK